MITAVVWLVVTIYQSLTEPAKIAVDPAVKSPLSAKIDQEALDNILARDDLSLLPFEPPSATESAISINEIVPVASESSLIETDVPVEQTDQATSPELTPAPISPSTSE